ncbi:HD domain-containing protein [Chromobacterium vaccinii]|uniref:HD domain-containing protein n=1 Tax=Chromobacterium vaccinii TaxID=1108595 RepID=UPI0031D87C43
MSQEGRCRRTGGTGASLRRATRRVRWHLLPFHMLDVAAVMEALLDQRPDWGQVCAASLGWDVA